MELKGLNIINKDENIKFHIDSISFSKDNNKVSILGWIFNIQKENFEIELDKNLEFEIKYIQRSDVYRFFNQEYINSKNSGFDLNIKNIKNIKKLNIYFNFDNEKSFIIELDLNKIKKTKRNILYKKLIQCISFSNFIKLLKYTKKYGIKNTYNKIKYKLNSGEVISSEQAYVKWIEQKENININDIDTALKYFKYNPKISIVMPVYNVEEVYLIKAIESVINQKYTNWELCIADDNSSMPHIKKVLDNYKNKYQNIKIVYRTENGHISKCTNSALELATGEFIGFMDNDDELTINALFEVVQALNNDYNIDIIYTDEDKLDYDGKRCEPHFKPDWSPDLLMSCNYITHFLVIRKTIVDGIGGFRVGVEGSQDYDLTLRATELSNSIHHIPKILYHWRKIEGSTSVTFENKTYVIESTKKCIEDALLRRKIDGNIEMNGNYPKVCYKINGNPLVSIVIPNKDHIEDLDKCLKSIVNKSTYTNYEVIIVENNSKDEKTFNYYKNINNENIKVVNYNEIIEFNFSAIVNYGVSFAQGEYLLILNNDTEVITPNWIENMLQHCQMERIGIVGAKLYYPDDTIQHGGIVLGLGYDRAAGHVWRKFDDISTGYMNKLKIVQNFSAVTGACLMVKKYLFDEVKGFDMKFKVAFNDIDFCLRVRELGYSVVWTPYAELYHYESKSRGLENTDEKQQRFLGEINLFKEEWSNILEKGDPFYNVNLTLNKEDFSIDV